MSKTFKIVLSLLVAASIGCTAFAVFSFIGKEREYMKRLMLEDKLAATLKDKRKMEKELNANKKAQEEAEAKAEEAKLKMKKLSSVVKEIKENARLLSDELAAKETLADDLKQSLEQERNEKRAISGKVDELTFEYERAKKDVSRLKREKNELLDEIEELKEKVVKLDKIVVNPPVLRAPVARTPAAVTRPQVETVKQLLEGRVLVVNRDYSFVVTDLGLDDGVQKGMKIEIRDGDTLLGKAEVDKVYDTMSSATVSQESDINNIKKGNIVIESR